MSRVSIRFFQPVAGYLGYPKPGGISFDAEVDTPCPLRNAIGSLTFNGLSILQTLQERRIRITVALNGRISAAGLDAEVQTGDKVSILPLLGGG